MIWTVWLWGAVVPVAWLIDRTWGEPPVRWHPVVAMGRYLNSVGAPWEGVRPVYAWLRGMAAWCVGAALCGGLAFALEHGLSLWMSDAAPLATQVLAVLILGCALKPMLAWRMLREEVQGVASALTRDLPSARLQLARVVSRDTCALSDREVREGALETLSENLNDAWVAPLFWFVVAGLPGAAVYRFANTADAMWGYRGRWEWAGKWAARADDVMSWLPARLTALLLACAAGRWPHGLSAQARRTPSPNGGWPMAALALLLNVRLAKPGVYVLHAQGLDADAESMSKAIQLCERAVIWSVLLACAVTGARLWP